MNSHELAKQLLSRRVNDVKIEVIVDHGNDEITHQIVGLRDSSEEKPYTVDATDLVSYQSVGDYILIRVGSVYVGDISNA